MPGGKPPRPFSFSCVTVLARRRPPAPGAPASARAETWGCTGLRRLRPSSPGLGASGACPGRCFHSDHATRHLLVGPNSTSWVSDSFVTVFPAMTWRPQRDSHRATKAQEDPRPTPRHRPVPRCLIPVARCTDHKATGHCHARCAHATVLPPMGALVGGVTQPFSQSQGPVAGFELVLTIDTYLLCKYNLSFVS